MTSISLNRMHKYAIIILSLFTLLHIVIKFLLTIIMACTMYFDVLDVISKHLSHAINGSARFLFDKSCSICIGYLI